jgi:hypothetical protein
MYIMAYIKYIGKYLVRMWFHIFWILFVNHVNSLIGSINVNMSQSCPLRIFLILDFLFYFILYWKK